MSLFTFHQIRFFSKQLKVCVNFWTTMKLSNLRTGKDLRSHHPDTPHSLNGELRPKNKNEVLKFIFVPESIFK